MRAAVALSNVLLLACLAGAAVSQQVCLRKYSQDAQITAATSARSHSPVHMLCVIQLRCRNSPLCPWNH
jgi:hypothetical protein